MAEVYSLPASTSLLAEVNAVGDPRRDKAQDGTVGDTAHEQHVSDHNRDETGNTGSSSDSDNINEVHARDVDSRGPWLPGWSAERIVQLIVANTRAKGYQKRRVKYVIYRGRIWVWRKVGGVWQFVQQAYTGADQHNEHFHVSFEYGSGSGPSNPENDTSPWGILAAHRAQLEAAMPISEPEFTRLSTIIGGQINQKMSQIAEAVWNNPRLENPYTKATQSPADFLRYAPSAAWHQATQQAITALSATLNAFVARETADDATKMQALQAIHDSIAAVAPGVAAQVIAALPNGSDPVSQDEVTAAVETAFRRAFAPATA